jgi:hypothetical protein
LVLSFSAFSYKKKRERKNIRVSENKKRNEEKKAKGVKL